MSSSILVINAAGRETRVALVENGHIAEFYLERKKDKGIVGNIYKGRVVRVLPGMQAAFVDIGLEKAAFLYVTDVFYDPEFARSQFELTEGEHDVADEVPELHELSDESPAAHEVEAEVHELAPGELAPPEAMATTEAHPVPDDGHVEQAAANEEGITVFALKQVVHRKPKVVGAMSAIAGVLVGPVSQKVKTKR